MPGSRSAAAVVVLSVKPKVLGLPELVVPDVADPPVTYTLSHGGSVSVEVSRYTKVLALGAVMETVLVPAVEGVASE